MKKLLLAFASLLATTTAFAGPSSWDYFDGKTRIISANTGWNQLEGEDKDYCNGRVKVTSTTPHWLWGTTYTVYIEGSWCDNLKIGYQRSGDRFLEQGGAVQQWRMSYVNATDDQWSGHKITLEVPSYAAAADSTGINLVLFTDSRDDTKKQAYEKIRVQF